LGTLLKEKKEKNKDGKYFFIVNFHNILYDETFNKKLNNYSTNNNNKTKFFFVFKFGKNIKKMSNIFAKEESSKILNEPSIYYNNLNYKEMLELNLEFSSKNLY
jgi:hypothetical protein